MFLVLFDTILGTYKNKLRPLALLKQVCLANKFLYFFAAPFLHCFVHFLKILIGSAKNATKQIENVS